MKIYYKFNAIVISILMVVLNIILLTKCDITNLNWLTLSMFTILDIIAIFAVWLCISELNTNYKK